jgi:HEAT repeat protein
LIAGGFVAPVAGQAATPTKRDPRAIASEETVESLFKDFLHYANIGQFMIADSKAKGLLAHPDLDPVKLLEIATNEKDSIDTLLIIIANSSIPDTAQKVLDVINEGERRMRKDPARIRANIAKLGGPPQHVAIAIGHLRESGEYAIPYMVESLLDKNQQHLWPRVVTALPKIGKDAINPLVAALPLTVENVRQNLIHALGEIGYPHAVPYLRELMTAPSVPDDTKAVAHAAIARIEELSGLQLRGSVADLLYWLADGFYQEEEAVRADPRVPEANVWRWNAKDEVVEATVVPQKIFGQVMAMDVAERALLQQNDHPQAIAVWLAANIRREGKLGMNVESGDPAEQGEVDPTRPDNFARALSSTQATGPRYAHLALGRAVADKDPSVALGAIAALRNTAGESSLIGTEDYKQPLAQSLHFPDLMVRIRAAMALGHALPRSQFADSQFVVPILAGTLALTGREQILVIDADQENLNRVVDALREGDRDVIGATNFLQGLGRARAEFQYLSAIFIATDITDPGPARAIETLRSEFQFEKTPVVVLTKRRDSGLAEELTRGNQHVQSVLARAADAELVASLRTLQESSGQQPVEAGLALSLALEAAETLHKIAVDGRNVYDVSKATPALIPALGAGDEKLRITCANVLAMIPTEEAQRAIAHVALLNDSSPMLRVAAFGALADSAKHHGEMLEEPQIDQLIKLAQEEPDLVLRNAASQALGAMNLTTNKASEIIRSASKG